MNKSIKDFKSNNNSGFTLIELLGVFVIMGLIILVAMPNVYRLISKNNNKDYSTYYEMIEFGANKYADDARSQLGTTNDIGCTRITLDDLVQKEYVSEFSKQGVTCSTGSTGITIRNNNGKITIKYKLSCSKGTNLVYTNGIDDMESCVAYKGDNSVSLVEKISGLTHTDVNNISYINSNMNYVKFSGQLFRIVSINKTLNTIKMVSADPVASIRYNGDGRNAYTNSDIEMWLNNEFLSSLQKDYKMYLSSSSWKPSASITRKAVVGLITKEDYSHIKSWYGQDNSWLLDEGSSNNGYIANAEVPASTIAVNSFHSVRPAVTLNSEAVYYDGDGTRDDPFIVTTTAKGIQNEYLNGRLPGEYVYFSGSKYRIVSTNVEGTKLVGTASIGKKIFAEDVGEGSLSYMFDSSSIGLYLNGDWINTLSSEKNLLDNGDFCLDTINNTVTSRLSSICIDGSMVKTMKVGLPKIGEMFTGPSAGINYWTLNPNQISNEGGTYTNSTMNVINSNGTISGVNIKDTNTDTIVVIYLSPNVKINYGDGTEDSPYSIK